MTDTISKVQEHYRAAGLTARIRSALAAIPGEEQALTVAQLAPLDQFHTRGILATAELAGAAEIEASTRVLDLGCGVGGPARYLAATFGCHVTGIDLSHDFIEAGAYLTERCGLADRVKLRIGDALHPPFEDGVFDAVFLLHVAMNIEDRDALYAGARRVLARGGRLVIFDVVRRGGGEIYPVPWAREASASFL
ncbi:MAG TPA: methyltransferase domain-containing protein, partial [Bryobacteraceae bacterium]|nr:methyltransferase domain-containing protein [Bryobacteraceae bacterium]